MKTMKYRSIDSLGLVNSPCSYQGAATLPHCFTAAEAHSDTVTQAAGTSCQLRIAVPLPLTVTSYQLPGRCWSTNKTTHVLLPPSERERERILWVGSG